MTPTRLRECLALLFWSQRRLAEIIGWSEGTVRNWALGRQAIPADVAKWLERLAKHAAAHPAPARNTPDPDPGAE